jgi:ABC-type microcin C transport system permease subunit YejE
MKVLNRHEIQAVSGALAWGINPYIFSYALLCGVDKLSFEDTMARGVSVGGLVSGVFGLIGAIGSSVIGGVVGYLVADFGYQIGNNWKNA